MKFLKWLRVTFAALGRVGQQPSNWRDSNVTEAANRANIKSQELNKW